MDTTEFCDGDDDFSPMVNTSGPSRSRRWATQSCHGRYRDDDDDDNDDDDDDDDDGGGGAGGDFRPMVSISGPSRSRW